jgi:putative salt-induced outer membrane protein YdiY
VSVRCWSVMVWCVIALGNPPSAAAQPTPPAQPPPPRLEASAQFAFLDTRGNATTDSLGAGGEVVWRPAPWTYASKATFAQSSTDHDLTARSIAALFRASRAIDERLAVYGQYDFLRDIFAGVEQRHIIEGGASYLVLAKAPHSLRADGGLGYLYERSPADHFDSVTLSLGAAYRLTLSKTSEFSYQPRWLLTLADAGAWKFNQEAVLTAALNTLLSLKLSHTLRYSAAPPAGFKTTDTIMAVSLVAKLRREQ